MKTPLSVLQEVFGYHSFRDAQEKIIEQLLGKEHALVLMPTGAGKSLCFQIPALLLDGVAIVISPLIALMHDQVASLKQLGVKAEALHSGIDFHVQLEIVNNAKEGELDILYLAPERFCSDEFQDFLSNCKVSLFAIDEAHCVSQWGHDFRPEYTELWNVMEAFEDVPRIALTATADEPTKRDIISTLRLEDARHFVSGFDRPNIYYSVNLKKNPKQQLIAFLKSQQEGDAGIVYCLSRRKVEEISDYLNTQGFKAYPYHAGLDAERRKRNQEIFLNEEGVIIVATIAFGMGIDKPNVRFVAHMDLPKSLEAYYQETGRAGRDGLPSKAWMVYGLQDVILQKKMIAESNAVTDVKILETRKLNSLLGFAETIECRRKVLLSYFGDDYQGNCENCDTCNEPQKTWEGLEEAQLALSCIYRTGQRFGVAYLIDVLRGTETERIINFGHNHLALYGRGEEHSAKKWHSIFRQLIAADYVQVDIEGYGGLQLTENARGLLRGEKTIFFREDPEVKRIKKEKVKKQISVELDGIAEEELFGKLKARRLELAREQNVPPYIIFHDRTLLEIAKVKPRTLETFSTISGVGASKLARYGEVFLEVVLSSGYSENSTV